MQGYGHDNLLDDGIGYFGDQCRRDIRVVHFLEGGDDLPRGHALGVQAVDLVIHGREPGLVLAHNLRLEAAVAVSWHVDIKRAILGQQRLAGIAVAAVGIVRRLMLLSQKVHLLKHT